MSGRRSRRGRILGRLLVLIAFLLLIGTAGVFAYLGLGGMLGGGLQGLVGGAGDTEPPPQTGELVVVEIPEGLTAGDVARLLERAGVIDSASLFVIRLRLKEATESLRPGRYELRQGEDYDRLIALLQEGGELVARRITLPEGLSLDQVAERLERERVIDGEQYAELAAQPDRFTLPALNNEPLEVTTLEGLLFPDTYFLAPEEGAEELIAAQLSSFRRETQDLDWAKAKDLGISAYQVVIVASLIEKEARVPEERALVSAVIYNRLKKEMSLGIDASTRYALKKWTGALTKSDLEIDSPYNTRVKKGLPPGPIASPGLAALQAALEPAKADYLYYVLKDEEGHHFFTASYDEFLEAKEQAPSQ